MPRRKRKLEEETEEVLEEKVQTEPEVKFVDYGENPVIVEIPCTTSESEHLKTLGLYEIGGVGKRFDENGNEILCVRVVRKHT